MPPNFTAAQGIHLSEFLDAPERPECTLHYCELAGFLFAVVCSPEMLQTSEWLPLVFNNQEGNFASLDEAQEILPVMLALYNQINSGVL
ncbi:MAG TPA: UPF0149 family protein [Gammaproteobacteria bacterium]|nr:UPF0149 family protein [Gammaproteobacteria bacterium]